MPSGFGKAENGAISWPMILRSCIALPFGWACSFRPIKGHPKPQRLIMTLPGWSVIARSGLVRCRSIAGRLSSISGGCACREASSINIAARRYQGSAIPDKLIFLFVGFGKSWQLATLPLLVPLILLLLSSDS